MVRVFISQPMRGKTAVAYKKKIIDYDNWDDLEV